MGQHTPWKIKPARRVYIPKANGKQRPLGIPGFFDNITHQVVLNSIGNVPARNLIKQWLKAGYLDKGQFHETTSGTPQGGIISPLLANIGLQGLENFLSQFKKKKGNYKSDKYGFVRYADDFIITATCREDIEAIQPLIEKWLADRGLQLNREKTRIVNISEGFNFLGFNLRQYKGKLLIKPQKEKVLKFLQEIRDWLKENQAVEQKIVIEQLNPKLRGFGNYYRHAVSKEVFNYIRSEIWYSLYRWASRRHPNKGKRWIANRYFKIRGKGWEFACSVKDRRGRTKELILFNIASIPIERHIKVQGTASPDDPTKQEYWTKRATKHGKTTWDKGSKYYQVAQSQNWKCPTCGEHLFNGEALETHHIIPLVKGGPEEIDNLQHLHKTCHKTVHSGKRSVKAEA